MLPGKAWGVRIDGFGYLQCSDCYAALLDDGTCEHESDCLTARIESAFSAVVEALQGELSPGRSDCNGRKCGACSRCRSLAALAAVEKLKGA